jgi:predicted metal-dependent phosphoesterase TrpH
MEVSTSEGHVLAFGVSAPIPRDLTVQETVERIVAAGGVAVAAHPYRFWSGLGERATLSAKFAAYEVRNARTLRGGNERADLLAGRQGVGRTGGSDAHFLDEHGTAFTVLDGGLTSVDDVLQALGSGRTRAEGAHRGPKATVVYVTKCVSQWIGRGMRRI